MRIDLHHHEFAMNRLHGAGYTAGNRVFATKTDQQLPARSCSSAAAATASTIPAGPLITGAKAGQGVNAIA